MGRGSNGVSELLVIPDSSGTDLEGMRQALGCFQVATFATCFPVAAVVLLLVSVPKEWELGDMYWNQGRIRREVDSVDALPLQEISGRISGMRPSVWAMVYCHVWEC